MQEVSDDGAKDFKLTDKRRVFLTWCIFYKTGACLQGEKHLDRETITTLLLCWDFIWGNMFIYEGY